MVGIERSHDDAGEAAVAIREASRELNRPLSADAADDRVADEQPVLVAVDVDLVVLAVAQIQSGGAGCGPAFDARMMPLASMIAT